MDRAEARSERLLPPFAVAPAAPASAGTASGSSAVAEWDHLIAEHFAPIKALVPSLPQEVQQATASFEKALQATRRVLEVAAVAKKPDPSELGPLLAPVAEAMGAVTSAAEARRLQCVQQLKMLAEAVAGLGFLAYAGPGCGMSPPRQHVSESWASAEFFANKTLMEFRGKDEAQVAWVKGVKSFMQQLEQFVVRNCATGLRFDPNGQPLAVAMAGGGAAPTPAPAAAAAAAPPPPRKAAHGGDPTACASDPNFQVVTAKCSALNVVVVPEPGGAEAEEADPVEHPVPEQFISTFDAAGKLVTVAAAHSGA
ncbi:Adenylyl cyclase-associated protein [Tetrabaena socialis]|uniref:Adenylyl cyclase-associated protein n=1 Tax=Tetrabaena socialis TaxID=47790 RepID=A0A2J8AGG5_9CHLO|nr:Adenylyl cyclase-associated protein [Tetrabaena socialis]|eukprot:PNH11586.1 Adenylyl cyclase-associated protein [Tetrabaena socialis]